MRTDYLLIWHVDTVDHDDDPSMLETIVDLRCIHRCAKLSIFLSDGGAALCSRDGHAHIVGKLFHRSDNAPANGTLSSDQWARIAATRGAALIENFWGGYVAFVTNYDAATFDVLRDPSGACPCFYRIDDGKIIVSSRADLIEAATSEACMIDWGNLVAHIAWPMIRHELTPLQGIAELLPGMSITCQKGEIAVRQAWSPWTFARQARSIPNMADAIAELRQRIIACVNTWSSEANHTLLAVSGGLDSSLVAAALSASDRNFSCLTLFTEELIGDERLYARELARYLGVELFEKRERVDYVDIRVSEARHLPRPVSRAFAQSGDRLHQEIAETLGVDQFMTGGGGDNVLCFLHSAAPIADRLMTAGARLGAGRTAFDVARLNEVGIAAALKGAFSKMVRRGLPHRWPSQTAFLSQVACEHIKVAPFHPWLSPPRGELPGKIMHVAWIAAIQNHLEGFGREWMYPLRAPLLAQPIVEHCLTIPSWFWCSGGRDRVLAREAFVGMLPPAVLNRRSKGTPTGFVMQILDENRGPIKELLLEGRLAKESIIDTARVEAFFADPDPRDVAPYMEIMGLVDVEAWLQAWAQPSPHLKANPRQLAGARGSSAHS